LFREELFLFLFFSPDGSDILFLASLAGKRFSGQQEIASTNIYFSVIASFLAMTI